MAANPGQMRFDYVAPSTIRHDAPQVRRDWRHDNGTEKLKGLEQSIRQEGILQPLLVRPIPAGSNNGYLYELIAGAGRLVCSLRVPLELVPVLVQDVDDDRKPILQLSENMHRRHLAAIDEAVAMRDVMAARGWNQARLARALGVSDSLVSQRIGLLRQELLSDALQRGLIAATTATMLRQIEDEERARPLYERLERGEKVTEPDVRAARAMAKESATRPADPRLGKTRPESQAKLAIVAEMRAAGASPAAIALALGLSDDRIRQYLAQIEADAQRPSQMPLSASLSRRDLGQEALRLQSQGLSELLIAARLGIGQRLVGELLEQAAASAHPMGSETREAETTRSAEDTEPMVSPGQQAARIVDRLPPEQAEALREAVGASIEAQPEDSTSTFGQPAPLEAQPQVQAQYGRDPQDVVVERPAPKSAVYREPRLEELFASVRHGPCWLPMGRILHKAAKEGLSAAALYEAYRAAGGSR